MYFAIEAHLWVGADNDRCHTLIFFSDTKLKELNIAELHKVTSSQKGSAPVPTVSAPPDPVTGSRKRKARRCAITRLLPMTSYAKPTAKNTEGKADWKAALLGWKLF